VVASLRHQDTDYDDLLMSGVPRAEARDQIRPAIDRLLATWSLSQPGPAVPRCLIVRIRLRGPAPCPVPGGATAAATVTMATCRWLGRAGE
jgi:hypothetical protein